MHALLHQSGKHLAHRSRQLPRMLAAGLVVLLCGTLPPAVAATTGAAAAAAESLYRAKCSVCHHSGAGNAPRPTQRQDWIERTARGRTSLYAPTINGIPN